MFKKILLIIFCFYYSISSYGQVIINEFSTSNTSNYGGGDEDWLELYNTSATTVNIGGYYLSDNPTNPTKWQIPASTTITANGYFTVLLSGNNVIIGTPLETNFKLTQTSQEWVVFSDASGTLIESYQMLVPTPGGHSRGKSPNGSSTWAYFDTPTPNAANSATSYTGYVAKPTFNVNPGFYTSPPSIVLSCTTPNAQIRYTTDGSQPTATSTLFNLPITVSTTTIIRAQAYPPSGSTLLPSLLENNTYFINVTHTVAVVSVSGNYGAATTGNGTFSPLNSNDIISSIEYFDAAQQQQWETIGEMRRHGNDSWAYAQKGIRFHTMDRFGYSSTINYPLMQTSPRQKYDVIILKAGASDNYPTGAGPTSNRAHIRDVFVQTFAEKNGIDLDGRRYEPCVLYVNGIYWGLYEIRERVDTDFTEFYYNQPDNKVDMLRRWGGMIIDAGSDTAWNNLRNYIVGNNMSVPANYQYVVDRLDIHSFLDYFIYNQFLVNTDVFNWNTHWWRGLKNAGVKWRFCMWDMDNTFGLGQNYSGLPGGTDCNSSPCGYEDAGSAVNDISQVEMFSALKNNPIFMQTYANRYAYLNNNVLTCEKLIPHLDSLVARITPEFPGQVARWGGTMAQWQANIQAIRDFLTCRCNNILTSLVDCNSPALQGPYEVCISTEPAGVGVITFDSTLVTTTQNCFTYFGGVNIPLSAISNNPEYEFSYWTLSNGTIVNLDTLSPNIFIQLADSGLIVANFKPKINVCIYSNPYGVGVITFNNSLVDTAQNCVSCFSGINYPLNATTNNPNYIFQYWSLPDGTIINTDSLSPNVIILLADSGIIIANFKLHFNVSTDTSICPGASILLKVTGGNSSQTWTDIAHPNTIISTQKQVIVSPNVTTFYNVNTNIGSDTVKVTVRPLPIVNLGLDSLQLCEADTVHKNLFIANAHYLWNDGDTNFVRNITESGMYAVKVTLEGCVNYDTARYQYYKYPVIELGSDTLLCQGESLLLMPTEEKDVLFAWSTSDTTATIKADVQNQYIVSVSRHLCVTTDTINISTELCLPCKAYIPNAFSPNSDGKNDRFSVTFREDKDCKLKDYRIDIYNQWGEFVFGSNNIKSEWSPPTTISESIYNFVLVYSYEERGEIHTNYENGAITILK